MEKLNYLYKAILFLILIFIIMCIVLPSMYFGFYKLINYTDQSIYVRYATNGKLDENLFFDNAVMNRTGFLEQLKYEIKELADTTRTQDFARIVYEHQNEVIKIIGDNDSYQEYLVNIGSSVDELLEWCEKTSLLDDRLTMASLYLTFLMVSFVMVVLFGFRKTFYICAGITYTIAMLSMFSDGITDYLVVNVIYWIENMPSDAYVYRDLEELKRIYCQAFKESTLTFTIFDTVIQICRNNCNQKTEKTVRYLHSSLEIQCSYLTQFEKTSNKYIARLNVPVEPILKLCNKEVKKNERKIRSKRTSSKMKNSLETQNRQFLSLVYLLRVICCSYDLECSTKEYILRLREIQWLMYKCNML